MTHASMRMRMKGGPAGAGAAFDLGGDGRGGADARRRSTACWRSSRVRWASATF